MGNQESHTITALVQDQPGVLNRVTSMIRRRNFNITSLAVGHSETQGLSRMTFVVEGDEPTLEQVTKQLQKLVNVIEVSHVDQENSVSRELALVRIRTLPETRSEIVQIVNIFRANIVDVGQDSMIIEITGDEGKFRSFVQLLESFGVTEIMRSGRLAMSRGTLSTKNGPPRNLYQTDERRRRGEPGDLGW